MPGGSQSTPTPTPTPTPLDSNGTLGTAGNWGDARERTDSTSGSIGFNGDQNDFIRFRVTDNRTDVDLTLSGLSADADLQLIRDWNNNGRIDPGEVIGSSRNSGTKVDSVRRVLDAGDYFIRVFPGTSSAKTNYNLQLKSVRLGILSGQVSNKKGNTNGGNVNLLRYNSSGKSNEIIESKKDTIVVIHGNNPSNESLNQDNDFQSLAKAAAKAYPDHQVLVLDWKQPASNGKLNWEVAPHKSAGAINPRLD
jgi:hypothetical protein